MDWIFYALIAIGGLLCGAAAPDLCCETEKRKGE